VIVSASYKTDIPALYSEWLFNRITAGYCMVRNPYGGKPFRVELAAADAWVFWTRNFRPLLVRVPPEPFTVQFTITNYPRTIDQAVIPAETAVQQMREIRNKFGPRSAVWRYDPILFTEAADHRENFASLAAALRGATDEVVISFAQLYRKTLINLGRRDTKWHDPPDDEKRAVAADLAGIAAENGLKLTVCSQAAYTVPGAEPAQCIDAQRLSDVAQRTIAARVKGNRPDCLCHESRDIGDYETCTQGCAYCYAVLSRARALHNFKQHDPRDEYLLNRPKAASMLT
jgi:hypothetical protein